MAELTEQSFDRLEIDELTRTTVRNEWPHPGETRDGMVISHGGFGDPAFAIKIQDSERRRIDRPLTPQEIAQFGLDSLLMSGPNLPIITEQEQLYRLVLGADEGSEEEQAARRLEMGQLREQLGPIMLETVRKLTELFTAAENEFYIMAYYGGRSRIEYYRDDSILYNYLRVDIPDSERHYVAPRLYSFGITSPDEAAPVHVEPVVVSDTDPSRVGFLPAGAIPIWEPLFRAADEDEIAEVTSAYFRRARRF